MRYEANEKSIIRFWSKVHIPTNFLGDCWVWKASKDSRGYGKFSEIRIKGPTSAHRISYRAFHGHDAKRGLEIDHLCKNTSCVNPYHLEAVTHTENVRRALILDHSCRRGHERTNENTLYYQNKRECKLCRSDAKRKSYYLNKNKTIPLSRIYKPLFLELNGKRMRACEWAKHLGMKKQTIYDRWRKGMPVSRILTPQSFYKKRGKI